MGDSQFLPDATDSGQLFEVLKDIPVDLPDKPHPLGDTYRETLNLQPDMAAEMMRLSKQLGEPAAVIAPRMDAAKAAAGIPPDSYFTKLEQQFPVTAKHIADPATMAVVKDDIPNLAEHEGIIQSIKHAWDFESSAFTSGQLQEERDLLQASRVLGTSNDSSTMTGFLMNRLMGRGAGQSPDERIAVLNRQLAEMESKRPQVTGVGSALKRGVYGATEFLPWMAGTFARGAEYAIPLGLMGAAAGAETGPGAAITGTVGVSTGFAIGGAEYNFLRMTGSARQQLQSVRDVQGKPLPENVINIASVAAGAGGSALGMVKIGAVLRTIPGGQEFLNKFESSLAGAVLKPASYKAALSAFAKKWATSTGEAAGAMAGITAVNLGAEAGAKAASGQQFDPYSAQDIIQQLATSAGEGALTFGVMGLPGSALGLAGEVAGVRKADLAKTGYLALGKTVEASKYRGRDQESYHKGFIADITKGTDVQEIRIPINAFDTYFQGKNIDPEQMALDLGVQDQTKTARETGGDLTIPTHVFTEKFGGTEHWKGLADDVKFNPEALTKRQTVERTKALDQQMQLEADAAVKEDPAIKEGMDFVHQDVLGKMRESGAYASMKDGEKIMEANAKLFTAAITVEAKRYGVADPKAYYLQGKPLEIVTGQPPGLDAAAQTQSLRQPPRDTPFDRSYRPNQGLDPAGLAGQERGAQYVRDNLEPILQKYAAEHQAYISTDAFRDLLAPAGYNGTNSAAYHEPARALRRIYEDRVLAKAKAEGKTRILLTAGGSGAGKTSFLGSSMVDRKDFGAIIDTTLSNVADAKAMILDLQNKGFQPEIAYISRDAADAWNAIIHRIRKEGRVVPLHEHIAMHEGSRNAIEALLADMPSGLKINLYQNELNTGFRRVGIESVSNKGYTDLEGRLTDATRKAHQEGHLSPDQLQSILAPYPRGIGQDERGKALAAQDTGAGTGLESGDRKRTQAEEPGSLTPPPEPPDPRNKTIFQGNNDISDPRGFIQFTPKKTIIGLLKADASTFPHELAHYWLKNFHEFVGSGLAQENHLADWKTLSDWLKVKGDQKDLTNDQQEKFAKGFEAYLREGRAPSESLRGVFAKFRRWLTRLYKDPIALSADLTDDVRGVMGRMLASEDEIAFAEQQAGTQKMPEIPGLDPAVQAKLSDYMQQAHDQAVDELFNVQMKEMTAAHRDTLAIETEKARKAAEVEAADLPEQKAMESLKRGFGRDGQQVARDFIDNKLTEEERISFRMIAGMQDYSSAGMMARKLLEARSFKDEVAARVQEKMAPFADLRNTDKIRAEAIQAVHNARATELMANERAIYQQLVDQAQGHVEAVKLRREEARIDALAAKAKAADIIAHSPLRDAGSFMKYFTVERQAALLAQKAAAEGKFQAAADAKQKQMVNHALVQESYRARKQIETWNNYIDNTRSKDRALFKSEEFFNQAAALMARFEVGRDDYDPAGRKETLPQWIERMVEQDEAVAISPTIADETLTKPFQDLTMDQARDVVNALKNIQRIANAQDNFYKIMAGASVQNTVVDLVKDAAANNHPGEREQIMRRKLSWLDRAKKVVAGYDSQLRTIENIALKLGGWKDDTVWKKVLWDPVERAADVESNMMKPLSEGLDALLKDNFTDKERASLLDYDQATFIPELNQDMRKMDLIMMAMHTGNESNRARLFETPLVGVNPGTPWGEQPVMDILQQHLTVKDWNFVQGTWDLIHSIWPEEAANHKEITGFTPQQIDPLPFNMRTADGQTASLRGGYFPLKSDTRANLRSEIMQDVTSPLYKQNNQAWIAVTKTGHLKARAEGAKYPVSLEHSVIQRHLRDAVHDVAFRSTIIDLRRLINNQQFADAVRVYGGEEPYKALRDWTAAVADGNSQQNTAMGFWENLFGGIRKNYVSSVLMFNTKIVTQNLANIFLYGHSVEGFDHSDVAGGFLRNGILDFVPASLTKNQRALDIKNEIYQKSPFMRDKSQSPDYSIQEAFDKMGGNKHKLRDFFFSYFSAADELTSIPIWKTAYEKAISQGKPEAESVQWADDVIRRSIGAARKYETAPIFRAGELSKIMATFQGFMNAQQNRWERERGILGKSPIKNAPRFAGYIAAHYLMFTAASNILSGNLPSLDDEEKNKRWLKSLLLYKFQMMPGLNAISSVVADQYMHIPSFGYKPMPQLSVIEKALQATAAGAGVISGTTEPADFLEKASHATALLTGAPDQFLKMLWNIYDIAAEGMQPQVSDLLERRPRSER